MCLMHRKKEEARVLVYGLCRDHAVFATYRREFLEELHITSRSLILDFTKYLQEVMKTFHELSYVVSCTENKYTQRIRGLRVLEGGKYLLLLLEYCRLVSQVLCVLCRRELISPPNIEFIVETSVRCGALGDETWLTFVLGAED